MFLVVIMVLIEWDVFCLIYLFKVLIFKLKMVMKFGCLFFIIESFFKCSDEIVFSVVYIVIN